jgi:hypothetical protein
MKQNDIASEGQTLINRIYIYIILQITGTP